MTGGHQLQFEGFRDQPGAPFYCASSFTPEQTWDETKSRLQSLIEDVARRVLSGEFEVDVDEVRRWHGHIFQTTFPGDAGRFRWRHSNRAWEHVSFGVRIGTAMTERTQPLRGATPRQIRPRIKKACERFRADVADLGHQPGVEVRRGVVPAVALYARLLRIHPFVDGNLRAGWVALQGGLSYLGLPVVLLDEKEHDEAISRALRSDGKQTYAPLADLVSDTIHRSIA